MHAAPRRHVSIICKVLRKINEKTNKPQSEWRQSGQLRAEKCRMPNKLDLVHWSSGKGKIICQLDSSFFVCQIGKKLEAGLNEVRGR